MLKEKVNEIETVLKARIKKVSSLESEMKGIRRNRKTSSTVKDQGQSYTFKENKESEADKYVDERWSNMKLHLVMMTSGINILLPKIKKIKQNSLEKKMVVLLQMQEKNNSEEAYYLKHEDHQGNKCKDISPSFLVLLKPFVEKHDKGEVQDNNSDEEAFPRQ